MQSLEQGSRKQDATVRVRRAHPLRAIAIAIFAAPSAQLRFTSEFGKGRKARSLGPVENVGETLMPTA
ncbi:MAG: hypothetical protein V7782_14115 [Psychromonas sp.]